MRQLREMGMVPAGLVACGCLALLVTVWRHPLMVVNLGAVALGGGTVVVVGDASGQRDASGGWGASGQRDGSRR
jgi:hypothetical protein